MCMDVDYFEATPATHTAGVRLHTDFYFLAMHCELFILCGVCRRNLEFEMVVCAIQSQQSISMHRIWTSRYPVDLSAELLVGLAVCLQGRCDNPACPVEDKPVG